MKSLSRSRITQIQTECVARYWVAKSYSVHLEVGLNQGGRSRADVLAMNTKGEIVIIEIKSCWQDFATDKKWQKYLTECNKFYFAIPKHLYETPKGQFIADTCKQHKVGLIVIADSPIREITKANKKTICMSHLYCDIRVKTRSRPLDQQKQFWLFKKLAWRSGISYATCSSRTKSFVKFEEEYQFNKSITYKDFVKLDPLEQYNYLKSFPKSSFCASTKDLVARLRFEKYHIKRLEKLKKI